MKGGKIKKIFWIGSFVFLYFVLITHSLLSYEKEIKAISLSTAESIVNAGKKIIAVVDFTDLQGNVTELGRFLAEELSVALASAGKGFEVVDRTHLKKIIEEHKLSSTGLIDPQTARELGQIAGVEALIAGSITPFGDSVRLAVKILDTNTAKMIGASSADIPKTKAIEELLAKGIGEMTTSSIQAPIQTTPSAQRKSPQAVQKVEVNNFTFELLQCKISGTSIACTVLITNNAEDRLLQLSGDSRTRVIDDLGNESKFGRLQIGPDSTTNWVIERSFVSGIPTKAVFTFENLSPQATFVALLEIRCYSDKEFKAQLRNIPVTR